MVYIILYWILLFGLFHQASIWFGFNKTGSYRYTVSFLAVYGVGSFILIFISFFSGFPRWFSFVLPMIGLYGCVNLIKEITKEQLRNVSPVTWILLLIFAGWSSSAAKLPDEGLYYLQSILWFKNFGLVPGLANFDFFLVQSSAFHAWTAALSSFSYEGFNDLGGFFALVFFWETLIKEKKTILFTLFSIFLVPLLILTTSASADAILWIGIFVFTLRCYEKQEPQITSGWVLVGLILTKISAFPLFVLLIPRIRIMNLRVLFVFVLGPLLHFFKSYRVSGELFSPFGSFVSLDASYKLPQAAFEYAQKSGLLTGYNVDEVAEVLQWGVTERLMHILDIEPFAILILLFFIILTLWLLLNSSNSILWIVISTWLFIGFWLYYSPQFRLAIPWLLSLWGIGVLRIPNARMISDRLIRPVYFTFLFASFFLLIVPVKRIPFLKENASILTFYGYELDNLLVPHSGYEIDSEMVEFAGLAYNKPISPSFCFGTDFPCNASMLRTFETDSVFYPVMLGESYKDGFGYASIPLSEFDTSLVTKYNAYSINGWSNSY